MLKAHCHERLTRYELPRRFVRVDQLPRTETGKPARQLAKELAAKGI